MTEKMLFGQALGIEEPVYVDEVKFKKSDGELHIYLDFYRGGHFKCAVCGGDDTSVHDTVEKCWRHLNFFQYKRPYGRIWGIKDDCSPKIQIHIAR